jgi:hypothetical protein
MTKREIGWLIAGVVVGAAAGGLIAKVPVVGSLYRKIPTVS